MGEDDLSDQDDEDDSIDDQGQFLSINEEEEIIPGEQINRFFTMDDYQQLLCKCVSALDLKGPLPPEASQSPDDDPNNAIKGCGEFFPFQLYSPKVFLLPIFFERQIKAEWAKPAANKQCPSLLRRLYKLPDFANDFLAVPLVDAPLLDIHSSGLLAEDGQGSLRDAWDKKIEIVLRHSHEALAIKACATASIVSQASIVWSRKMLELLPDSEARLLEGASRILKAGVFAADATLDGIIFASRSMALSVVARRALWLQAWQADTHSKQLVVAYPYKGRKLFGPALEKILIETKDKRKALPHSLRKPYQQNQSFRSQSFRYNRFS